MPSSLAMVTFASGDRAATFALNIKQARSSETSVTTYQTTLYHFVSRKLLVFDKRRVQFSNREIVTELYWDVSSMRADFRSTSRTC
jgi:hypothetical protein